MSCAANGLREWNCPSRTGALRAAAASFGLFRLAASRASAVRRIYFGGKEMLAKKFPKRPLKNAYAIFEKWGFASIAIPAIARVPC